MRRNQLHLYAFSAVIIATILCFANMRDARADSFGLAINVGNASLSLGVGHNERDYAPMPVANAPMPPARPQPHMRPQPPMRPQPVGRTQANMQPAPRPNNNAQPNRTATRPQSAPNAAPQPNRPATNPPRR